MCVYLCGYKSTDKPNYYVGTGDDARMNERVVVSTSGTNASSLNSQWLTKKYLLKVLGQSTLIERALITHI